MSRSTISTFHGKVAIPAGTISVDIRVDDPFKLTREEREIVFGIIDALQRAETRYAQPESGEPAQ